MSSCPENLISCLLSPLKQDTKYPTFLFYRVSEHLVVLDEETTPL